MAPPTGLRERKKQQVRDTLVEVAMSLFDAHGFDAVTVDQIVEQADVSQRTFFRYFASKEAVLFADQDEMRAFVRAAITDRPVVEPPLTALRHALAEVAERYAGERERHLQRARLADSGAAVGAYQRSVVIPQFEDVLADALATRLRASGDEDLRPRLLAGTAMAALLAAVRVWLTSAGTTDINRLIADAFDALETAALETMTAR